MFDFVGEQGEVYTKRRLVDKLRIHFSDSLLVTSLKGKPDILTFHKTFSQIIHKTWYNDRNPDPQSEKQRLTNTAAQLVAADIRSQPFECDTYPSPDTLELDSLKNSVPEVLHTLIEGIVCNSSCRSAATSLLNKRRIVAIEQAIMSATRPRSYLSPLLIGLGVYLHRRYDSRMLIDLLHAFGFSCSYDEAKRYQWSALFSAPLPENDDAFVQFIFDNADHNIKSLDGHGTFHSMGGIKCVTPRRGCDNTVPINRLKKAPKSEEAGKFGKVPHHHYPFDAKQGLALITVIDLPPSTPLVDLFQASRLDALWLSAFTLDITPHPGWGGFNQVATENQSNEFHVSDVVTLPFINLNPSNLSTIYTALNFALKEASRHGRNYCIVTFDQPLFIKAVDIVHASSELCDAVIVRLGGLHMTFSFMGADGYIMSGSGIEQLWSTVYAEGSIQQILNGHSYYRALRARVLDAQAIASIILSSSNIVEKIDTVGVQRLWDDLMHENLSLSEALASNEVEKVMLILEREIEKARMISRTSKLWIQHYDRVLTLLRFTRAERTGNWELHIHCVKSMLPTFHAAGHTLYAKSAQLYLQEMQRLEGLMPDEDFDNFTAQGYFTIRRTNKFWSGVWSDMTIEQVLMKSMKVQGGLVTGRGITEATLVQFICALPPCIPIMEAVEKVAGISSSSSEQHMQHRDHKELGVARQIRDAADLKKFLNWLNTHDPFDPNLQPHLVSVFSGLSADSTINCDNASEIGSRLQQECIGENFADLSLKRSAKVLPLSAMTTTIKVKGERVVINQQQMLNRVLAVLQSSTELEHFVEYEFVNYSPSLFDDYSMRKPAKPALAQSLEVDKHITDEPLSPTVTIIDGGHLLHAVVWPTPLTYREVIDLYVNYVVRHYKEQIIVVFNGYESVQTTKSLEQRRRALLKSSANITLILDASTTTNQSEFLHNCHNKASLIKELTSAFASQNIQVVQALGDADFDIVKSTMVAANGTRDDIEVLVVSRDTDILVMLLAKLEKGKVILAQPQPGKRSKFIDVQQMREEIGDDVCQALLPLHAVTGCDTTSAPFRKGKTRPMNLMKRNKDFQSYLSVFNNNDPNKDLIIKAGENILMMIYKVMHFKNLDAARYFRLKQMIARQGLTTTSKLSTLPPTSASAKMHSLRVYLQVQSWHGQNLDPLEWGWEMRAGQLLPIGSEKPAAPDRLLKLTYCDCQPHGCRENSACRCRQAGKPCTPMCGNCVGVTCANVVNDTSDE